MIIVDILLYLGAALLVMWSQIKVQGAYKHYRNVETMNHMSGAEVARRILDDNGLNDVSIEVAQGGVLSDHYDPKAKVVRLSQDIYSNSSIASVSVAAHEVGHAIQHQQNYGAIALRNAILPAAMISSSLAWGVLIFGLFMQMTGLLYTGIIMLSVVAVFQLVTLPIEFDASKRALTLLVADGILDADERPAAKAMLNAAAFTYVAALISSVMQILRFVLIAGRRND